MNKHKQYQEALDKIVKSCCPNCTTNGCKDCSIEKICNATAKSWVDTLQELVDKATPKIPYYLNYGGFRVGNWKCRSCDGIVKDGDVYCKHCGQALDRSGEDV